MRQKEDLKILRSATVRKRRKKAMKDATRSGSGSKEASVAEQDLKNYEFLLSFLRLKTTDDNLSIYITQQTNEMEDSDNSSSDSDDEQSTPVDNKSVSSNADNIENKYPNAKQPIRKRPTKTMPSQEDVVC